MTAEKPKNVIFRDELCDAKSRKRSLACQKGTLKFTGDNAVDFRLYRAWCEGCKKLRIVDRKELVDAAKGILKQVVEMMKGIDEE